MLKCQREFRDYLRQQLKTDISKLWNAVKKANKCSQSRTWAWTSIEGLYVCVQFSLHYWIITRRKMVTFSPLFSRLTTFVWLILSEQIIHYQNHYLRPKRRQNAYIDIDIDTHRYIHIYMHSVCTNSYVKCYSICTVFILFFASIILLWVEEKSHTVQFCLKSCKHGLPGILLFPLSDCIPLVSAEIYMLEQNGYFSCLLYWNFHQLNLCNDNRDNDDDDDDTNPKRRQCHFSCKRMKTVDRNE